MSIDDPRRTAAAQAHPGIDPRNGAVAPALQPATTFARGPDGELRGDHMYARYSAPTQRHFEELIAKLEGGADARAFSSGLAAAAAMIESLPPNARVIAQKSSYFGVQALMSARAQNGRIKLSFFEPAHEDAITEALNGGDADLIWIETPANPLLDVVDISAAAKIAHQTGAKLIVDSTAATPVATQPLALGADLVMHSATKYLSGHGDVLAGVLVARAKDDFWARVDAERRISGANLGAFEAWLLIRSLRTLFVRVEAQSASALALAQMLEAHPRIERVLYPGLVSHPRHSLARKQMNGVYGGMASILIKGDFDTAARMTAAARVFIAATSFGATESLIEHRRAIEHEGSTTPPNLVRLSVGLEARADLLSDLEQALEA